MHTLSVLIDDRIDLAREWTNKGGIFIHHTDAKSTLQKLVDKGILTSSASGFETMINGSIQNASAKNA
jgi:hypothetical protein